MDHRPEAAPKWMGAGAEVSTASLHPPAHVRPRAACSVQRWGPADVNTAHHSRVTSHGKLVDLGGIDSCFRKAPWNA